MVGNEGIDCSQEPIGCTLEDRGEHREPEVERETGPKGPSTNHRVEFIYRL